MLKKLCFHLLAGLIFALGITLLVSLPLLVIAYFLPLLAGPIVITNILISPIVFFGSAASYFAIMTLKLWAVKVPDENEGYWVLSSAALIINVYLVSSYGYWSLWSIGISIVYIFLGNLIYRPIKNRRDRLLVE